MLCSHCNTQNPADFSFCLNCGVEIAAGNETQTIISTRPPVGTALSRDLYRLLTLGLFALITVVIVLVLFNTFKR